ncbi:MULTISPECIES: sulfite oxidase-like oxidoreductase [unclassified Schlesneria]|uniref:sulfite oxidase-like oxidoreductase n=1 Tax=unclassified Schlesneria TaxID=2762017 RepID=UPI002EDE8E38
MLERDPKYQTGEPEGPKQYAPPVIISRDTYRENRIPPGQSRTRKWPVLQWGRIPEIPPEEWTLEVTGLVERPLRFTYEEFRALPRVKVFSDFHCVTRWSRLGNVWEGVSVQELMNRAGVKPEARFVVARGNDDGWTTNMPLSDFQQPDVLLADTHDGEAISFEHGGPVRLVVPLLYAWKSAKWCSELVFLDHDQPGLWEQQGYHNHGDPWLEERFGSETLPPGWNEEENMSI